MSTAYHHRLAPASNNNGASAAVLRPAAAGPHGPQQLLQQPTKLLGCLRTVGRPTSAKNPLLVAAVFENDGPTISRVDVKLVDVATGSTVARLDRQGNGHFGCTGGLLCIVGTGGTAAVSVLDPSTGDVTAVPAYATGDRTSSAYVFGHVPSTGDGEHKVLRVFNDGSDTTRQTCEILTLNGKDQRWRPARGPPVRVGTWLARHRAVTAGGVAYFLIPRRGQDEAVASFDMAAEAWRPTMLRCPVPETKRNCCSDSLSLVELGGHLVFVYHDYVAHVIDMWVLASEAGEGAWVKMESLPFGKVLRGAVEMMARPLMVLEDGRIAFWFRAPDAVVRVYDPRSGVCEEVANLGSLCSLVGLYRGNLRDVNY